LLNSDTKRHIDAARDVLVGVAPNPTTQIDQITYALIYKFMDDMDQASVKAGGEASFFVGDLEKYAWSNLISTRMGNQEKMDLYSEALSKFSLAKQLPELFRTIFRAASLPYRSPETLGLFLKEISYFDYTHPEELGNAYEYLLSIMSSQGDAGQFRTPRHIIDFIVDVINPTKEDKVLDPACGTGGFLVSTYNHILEQHDGKDDPKSREKPLTPDERKKLMSNLQGYDIDPTMVRIAQVNMYLHQFKNPQIFQYDSLTSEERWHDKYDVILANPPFMSPKGGIKPHNKFGVSSNRAEVLFVDYIINHLKPKGRAGIVVPEGVIFQNGNAYRALRKNLVENGLFAVVSLPAGVFQPYSGVKTSILLIDNEQANKQSEIAFLRITADGFDLGSSKRPVAENDLPDALELLKARAAGQNIESSIVTLVSKEEISIKGDYNLIVDRYVSSVNYSNSIWPIVKLAEVATVDWGNTTLTKSSYVQDGPYLAVSATGGDGRIGHFEHEIGTTVLSAIGANCGKVFYPQERFTAIKNTMTITPKRDVIMPKYLHSILRVNSFPRRGGGQPFISKGDAVELEIPLPPLEVQAQIVAELDGYAAIIGGAKLIAENWSPKVEVDPHWPITTIGLTCKLHTGGTPTSSNKSFYGGDIPWLVSGDIHKGEVWECEGRITSLGMESSNARYLPLNSVLIALNGQGKTRGTVALLKMHATCNQSLVAIEVLNNDLMPEFLYLILKGMYKQIRAINGENQRGGLNMPLIREIEIPMPTLEIQSDIVAGFNLEAEHVKSAIKLIETYEEKVANAISKLWGNPEGVD
jgi:type I restriction enzyme M protein